MARPSSYSTFIDSKEKIVAIEDNWNESMRSFLTVTNNIENVVAEIKSHHGFIDDEYRWIYKDTDGDWNGWDLALEEFIILNCERRDRAITEIKRYFDEQD